MKYEQASVGRDAIAWKYKRRIPMFQVTPDEEPLVETSKFSLYFSGSCIPTNESLFILFALPTLAQIVLYYNGTVQK